MFKKIAPFLLLILTNSIYASPDILISDVNPMPPKVVQNTIVSGIKYGIHNNNPDDTYTITFKDLTGNGISFTTTCASLAPTQNCTVTLVFNTNGIALGPYTHYFSVNGAPKPYGKILSTTIIQSGTDVAAHADIELQGSPGTPTPATFTVTLTGSDSMAHEFDDVPFGESTLSPDLPVDNYTAHIAPSTVSQGGNDYDAPSDFNFHLATSGDTAHFTYTENQDVSVSSVVTAPNIGSETPALACTGPASYNHDVTSGTNPYDVMKPGQYTCTSANYPGTDEETYIAAISNPVPIDDSHTIITVIYTAQPPTTEHVFTNITAPGLPTGNTVAITLEDGDHTYGPHNQAVGNTSFDTVVDASDYSLTCSNYVIGPDTYACTPSDPYTIDADHTVLNIVYSKKAPPGANYDWHAPHLTTLKDANFAAVYWGGGSTTAPVQISTNPPINPWLDSQVAAYEEDTVPVGSNAHIKHFPSYIAMGTITETDGEGSATAQLKTQKLDLAFHYEGLGKPSNCFFDDIDCPGAYTPLINALATQEAAVTTFTGHQLMSGVAFYTMDYSDYPTETLNNLADAAITGNFYNLLAETVLMQTQYNAGNPMMMLLNFDSTVVMQKCGQWYCPISWKPGLTQDTATNMISLPNLQADIDTAIDRLVIKGYINSGVATAMKADLVSNAVLTPPGGSGRTTAGLPEYTLANIWGINYLGPDIPVGVGNNEYDSANPLLLPAGTQPWETSSFDWIHKVNHIGLSPTLNTIHQELVHLGLLSINSVPEAVDFEAQKFMNFAKQMDLVGDADGHYKPDFLFFDRFERDVIPSFVPDGFVMNGVDMDTYVLYMQDIDGYVDNIPLALVQMPGATMQVQGATFSGDLSDTIGDWTFGHPELNNDMSNLATALNFPSILFTETMNTTVYYTKNAGVTNLEEYVKLTNAAP